MKLVDILARELKEWPGDWCACAQESNGMIAGFKSCELIFDDLSGWNNTAQNAYIPPSRDVAGKQTMADDWRTTIVTRAQWQAAVDALKAESCAHLWVGWSEIEACELCNKTRKIVVEWNGEGLPPVGVDALLAEECKFTEGTRLDSFPAGTVVYVGGHANFGGCDLAVIIIKGRHFCGTIIPELLKPIRTPEQVAAEERYRCVQQMAKELKESDHKHGSLYALYDLGYRKFEIVDN